IGGDLIDSSLQPRYTQRMYEELSALNAGMGVYMVPGNHEYISGIEECVEFLAQTPVVLLRDSVVTLPCGLQIAGRDDRTNSMRMDAASLVAEADAGKPVLLLDHQPYGLAENDALGIDVQFSGHTHAGQLWPGNLIVRRMYEQASGWRKWENAFIYVSSGLSLWGPPFRIGTSSDMAVLTLHGK
ncbi:MAG: metallophosphoesterase, partial [Bacteroidales bacterium]|nr:metallophosphoesterase [Bacteroidales bacterium]